MDIGVKYVVVIKREELDVEGTKELLSRYGEVTEVEDSELEDGYPVALFYIDGTFGQFVKIKLELNCIDSEENKYILFPMASREDKNEVLKRRGIIPEKI